MNVEDDRPIDPPERECLSEQDVTRIRDWYGDEFDRIGAGAHDWLEDRPEECINIAIAAIWVLRGVPAERRNDAEFSLRRSIDILRDKYIHWREASKLWERKA